MHPPVPTLDETRAALAEARRVPIRGIRSVAVCCTASALVIGSMWATAVCPPLVLCLPAALGFVMFSVIIHEAAHGTLFGGRPDGVVGALLGLVALTPFGAYRRGHAAHHRFSGTARDPAPAPLEAVEPSRLLDTVMRLRLLPVFYWAGVYGRYLLYDLMPGDGPRQPRHIARWALELSVGLAIWAAVAIWASDAAIVMAGGWLGGGVIYEHAFTFNQHLGLAPATPAERYDHRTQTHFARTIELPLSGLFMHFNLHKEHHLAPGLSWQQLPALHDALRRRRPDMYRFTDHRPRLWARHRGPAHTIMSPSVGETTP